jgi:transketolase
MAKSGRNARPAEALKGKRERQLREMPTDIENIISKVVGQDSYNPTADMEDSVLDKIKNRIDFRQGTRQGRNVGRGTMEFSMGGDVRYNSNRGKTF